MDAADRVVSSSSGTIREQRPAPPLESHLRVVRDHEE